MVFISHEQLSQFAYEVSVFIVVILFTAIVAKISNAVISRVISSSSPYLAAQIKHYVFILVWATGIILGIRQVGISTDIIMLFLALVGVGFIVSASYVLQNIVSRYFMNLQMQYKAGDLISINNFKGKVLEITDLNTVLLDDEGNLVSIPNVLFLKEVWIKYSLSGYEITIPIEIKKEIDIVNFEKKLINSLTGLNKYFKKKPQIITLKTEDKTTELSLILNLKDPEKKSIVSVEINEKISKLIAELAETAENNKIETELKEIKDISK